MNNFYNKISKDLLNTVFINSNAEEVDCIVFSRNYNKLRNFILENFKNVKQFPFISAFGLKLGQDEVIKLAKISTVSFISKQTKVSTQIFTSKQILGVNNLYEKNYFGKNISVAIIDTGINPHLDFIIPNNRYSTIF